MLQVGRVWIHLHHLPGILVTRVPGALGIMAFAAAVPFCYVLESESRVPYLSFSLDHNEADTSIFQLLHVSWAERRRVALTNVWIQNNESGTQIRNLVRLYKIHSRQTCVIS